ncbi:LTA synthase family protein [Colwellia ponticola]|uniref:LTA synthase family protein n=2 Tax=Colwellia ponticola TaxID=2304625 RepID=A0A8H2PLL4_9GAMM|nr:LTA synthase family protein [Colwellia ponticola]
MDNITAAQPYENSSARQLSTPLKVPLGALSALMSFYLVMLFVLSFSRLALVLWQSERTLMNDAWLTILINGLRIDISTLCYVMIFPLLLVTLSLLTSKGMKYLKPILFFWLTVALLGVIFFEVITPTFILEYDLRPNRLFIEYLIYPKEVFSMLFSGYKIEIATCLLALFISYKFSTLLFRKSWINSILLAKKTLAVVCFLLLLLCFLGARGTLSHRPINPAMMSFSTDHLLNDLSLNSFYSTAFALKQMQLEKGSESFYGKMSAENIFSEIQSASIISPDLYKNSAVPTQTYHQASYQGKPKNIVILLQESLGARYVNFLGGLPISPELDTLMAQGWNFTNLYATGTRSVRGIEAVITGFPPTTSRSVVKLGKSQQNFFTIAQFLKSKNYQTQFIYGGESHFDNMKSFFLGNGFTDIVDLPKFDQVDFEGSWGASDEDLYNQAHREFALLNQQERPFFSLVFTSSNHSPYDFPDNKISLYDETKNTRNNAAKYADYALGQFFKKAKQADYWNNTIFVIIADHDSRVGGAELVPIEHFHIPALIIGKGIAAKQDTRLASQIDMGPTLLSLAGLSGNHPMIGYDLTQVIPKSKQRAMMQYDKNFVFMTLDDKTFLQPDKLALIIRNNDNELSNDALAKRAKAHALLGSYLYETSQYH